MEVKEARIEVENGEGSLGTVTEEGAQWKERRRSKGEKVRWKNKEGAQRRFPPLNRRCALWHRLKTPNRRHLNPKITLFQPPIYPNLYYGTHDVGYWAITDVMKPSHNVGWPLPIDVVQSAPKKKLKFKI